MAKPSQERKPAEPAPAGSVYDQCVAIAGDVAVEDPLSEIRTRLTAVGKVLALAQNEDPRTWSVYAEHHRVGGVRFMLRDAAGREVDLQRLPADVTEALG